MPVCLCDVVAGCPLIDATGFALSALNTRFVEDVDRMVSGKSTYFDINNVLYIYWCGKEAIYYIGIGDRTSAGYLEPTTCSGAASTVAGTGDFLDAAWNEVVDGAFQVNSKASLHCGHGAFVHLPDALGVRSYARAFLSVFDSSSAA